MITTTHPRPLTSRLTEQQVALTAMYSPAHAQDHLVHGWLAVGAAVQADTGADERKQLDYARSRLACARSEPVARAVAKRDRAAFEAECASLERAIGMF